jgi:hypothetical protein
MKPIDILINGKHSEDISKGVCTFCSKKVKTFRNTSSEKEYKISGFCQECQDKVFGKD